MWREAVPLSVAAVVYGLAVAARIELVVGEVTLGAAFAPALAVIARGSTTRELAGLGAGVMLGLAVGLLARRPSAGWREVPALVACFMAVIATEAVSTRVHIRTGSTAAVLVAGALGLIAYSLVADGLRHVHSTVMADDRRVWLLLQGVLLSAYGLMILGYRQFGWPTLVAMLVVLGLPKREFDRYAIARRTLAQTVEALSALREASLS
jgi:hypothetical protein